ncbi:MAG: ribonuclease HII [Desulfobacterales bacterium]|jgi:ribonuclease HII|nr:ribonuclease HII [Desulfobacterales bacterium]MCU0585235.1 ribonuclease HII [Desulfobacterales bacterium]
MDRWRYEKRAAENGCRLIAGVDEAGRGPLAGPVVAAAVILPEAFHHDRINDSKQLSPALRERLYDEVYRHARSVGIGIVDALEIDRINILQASLRAMAVAVGNLLPLPDCLLIDGTFRLPLGLPQEPIPQGDAASLSIAAASIVAKVTRDRLMNLYHLHYPDFGFDRHKGYPTRAHQAAIRAFGCSPIHRRTFRGVREHLPPSEGLFRC